MVEFDIVVEARDWDALHRYTRGKKGMVRGLRFKVAMLATRASSSKRSWEQGKGALLPF